MRKKTTDVAIIGGGVVGTAIAYYLSKYKVKPLLIESGNFASGASGACGGFVFLQTKRPGVHLRLAIESSRLYDELSDELNEDIEFRRRGGLILIETEGERSMMETYLRERSSSGLEISLMDRKEMRSLEPMIGDHIIGGVYCPMDGQVNPLALNFALAKAALGKGTEVLLETRILALKRVRRTWMVRTKRCDIEADKLVIAAGAWSGGLGRMIGLNIPIRPRRGQILVTEPVPRVIGRGIISAGYIAAKLNNGLGNGLNGKRGPTGEEELGFGLTVEQTENGNMLIGSTREFVGFDNGTTWEAIRLIAKSAVRTIPLLKDVSIIRTFAGLRPYTSDGLPFLGEVEGVENLIIASGHEGDGIALAPITGKLIAELIAIGSPSIDLAPLTFRCQF